jgi:flagellar hook-basal body complex protein FliE
VAVTSLRMPGTIDPRLAYGGAAAAPPPPTGGASFAEALKSAVQSVDRAQTHRNDMVEGAVTGQVGEVHDVMVAAEEAQLAFELMLEVRNRLLESYQQVMQMQM